MLIYFHFIFKLATAQIHQPDKEKNVKHFSKKSDKLLKKTNEQDAVPLLLSSNAIESDSDASNSSLKLFSPSYTKVSDANNYNNNNNDNNYDNSNNNDNPIKKRAKRLSKQETNKNQESFYKLTQLLDCSTQTLLNNNAASNSKSAKMSFANNIGAYSHTGQPELVPFFNANQPKLNRIQSNCKCFSGVSRHIPCSNYSYPTHNCSSSIEIPRYASIILF